MHLFFFTCLDATVYYDAYFGESSGPYHLDYVMDMRLTCWVVLVGTLLVGSTAMVLMFITVLLEMRLGSSVMVCGLFLAHTIT